MADDVVESPDVEPSTGIPTPSTGMDGSELPSKQQEGPRERISKQDRAVQVPETLEQRLEKAERERDSRARQADKHLGELRRVREEMATLRQMVEPVYRAEYQRMQELDLRRQAAGIPDKESDPIAYNTWVTEQLRNDIHGQREVDQRAQEELSRTEALNQLDSQGHNLMAGALGGIQGVEADPEFAGEGGAYEHMVRLVLADAQERFPDADLEQYIEFAQLYQASFVRDCLLRGQNPVEVLKSRARRLGWAPGNGATRPVAARSQQGRTSTRLEAESARAARAKAVSGPVQARTAGGSGEKPSIRRRDMSEDDYIKARMSGAISDADVRKQMGDPDWG